MDPLTIAAGIGAIDTCTQVYSRLKVAGNEINKASAYLKNSSLIDVAQVARVEPIAMIDADVMNVEYIGDVMQTLHTMFSGYYLQAINLISTIGSVSVASKLSPLNPNRGLGFESHVQDVRMGASAYRHRLPTKRAGLAMEAEASKPASATDKEGMTVIREATNLAVGKMFNVTLREGEHTAVVPISIRLMVNTLPTSAMVALFTFKDTFDMDLKERYHAWKAGRLSFIKDLVLCRDLINKHRTALVNDKSDVYAQIVARENGNRKAGLANQSPSLATASNLAVLSSDTLATIELKLNGKFANFKVRQTVFDNTNLMILAVVDKAWERVTFYHRGVQGSTQVSVRDMKVSNKSSGGSEVMDIMKAYMAGSNPQL